MDKLKVNKYVDKYHANIEVNEFFDNGFPRLNISIDPKNIMSEENSISLNFGTGKISIKNRESTLSMDNSNLSKLGSDIEKLYRDFIENIQNRLAEELEEIK